MNYQDMLTKLGLGSAHPGGFNATLDCLKLLDHTVQQKILEVGCGTGRTATTLAKMGHDVTAVDIREGMIKKAEKRAAYESVNIEFLVGDVCNLPFKEKSFDVVIVESVTVFVDLEKAISEYIRVLKYGGRIYDREMMGLKQLTIELRNKIRELYGALVVPSPMQWQEIFIKAGFNNVSISNFISIENEIKKNKEEIEDPYQIIDEDLLQNPDFFELSLKNNELMIKTAPHLGHGIIMGTK